MKLKVSDEVIVKIGKDKGKKGRIEKSYPKLNKFLVAGVNLYKKHLKKGKKTMQAGIIDIPVGSLGACYSADFPGVITLKTICLNGSNDIII